MYKPSLEQPNQYLRAGLLLTVLVFTQTILFITLHDSLIDLAIELGAASHVKGGVGWGLTIYYSTFGFTAICLICGFLSLFCTRNQSVYFASLGFALFSSLFVQDLFRLTEWAYPRRALIVIVSAFVALILPHLLFSTAAKFVSKVQEQSVASGVK